MNKYTFEYSKLGSNYYRPIIPITLFYKDEDVTTDVLVDSGADINVFSTDIADVLGVDLSKCKNGTITSATGHTVSVKITKLQLALKTKKYLVPVVFQKGDGDYGFVGQYGFFDIFKIMFDWKRKEIKLQEHKW